MKINIHGVFELKQGIGHLTEILMNFTFTNYFNYLKDHNNSTRQRLNL
jgi:hypothetical protein